MIVLRVLSYNGAPADGPWAQFDEIGGTIGRADNNQLVLPDPERTISRVHARVVFRGGGYAVVDNGSNPISVNGLAVGAGREQPLQPGDQLQIGGYVIEASASAVAGSSDPFADLFGDAPLGLAAAPAPASAAPFSAPAPQAIWPPPAGAPPAAAWPAPTARGSNAPPPLMQRSPAFSPTPAPTPAPRPAAPPPALAPGHIPEDWDPFAPDPADSAAPAPAGAARGVFDDLPAGGADSLDDLFGLGNTPLGGDPLADPFGAAPAQGFNSQPNTGQHADPLQSLARTASVVPASHGDHASELNTPMPRNLLQPASPAAAPATSATSVGTAPAALPAGAVFSWNDPPRDGRVVTLPGVRRAASAATPADASAPTPAPAPLFAPPPAVRSAPVVGSDGNGASNHNERELLQALLEGLNAPGLRLDALTPDSIRLVGQLLHESTRGAVELLVARAALKREMRAEMTMIVARENNPLKFSPNVEVALQHLLGAPTPGFMAPAPAMRDAFDDLRAHQLGVMAGMRAALEGVLQRFDPQQLEAKLTRKSAISSLIPSTRKARLWELFQELFTQLQTEAQDDFDELFGKAFLRAYEEQLDRLQSEPGPR